MITIECGQSWTLQGRGAIIGTSTVLLTRSSILYISLFLVQEQSAAKGSVIDDVVYLDVHAVSELRNQGLSPTNDLPKFSYTANNKGEYGECVHSCLCTEYCNLNSSISFSNVWFCTDIFSAFIKNLVSMHS